ncbi:MAG: alpha-glucosidase, partial [Oscillospiraceae bacterium]|nr:alpha-glucosidase [Oscillospiraceae bacterium]
MFEFKNENGQNRLLLNGRVLLSENKTSPMLFVGCGEPDVEMYRGNFQIEDHVTKRLPLTAESVTRAEDGVVLDYGDALSLRIRLQDDLAELFFTQKDPSLNRFWLRVSADEDENGWGCGEQMSYFDLRGR